MMIKNKLVTLLCLGALTLSLTACVSREQADEKLSHGCEAGAKAFLEEGYEIKEIKDTKFETADLGPHYRKVTLSVLETDGWANLDKDYTCIFREAFGFAQMSYSATIYQLNTGDQIIGQDGDSIKGTIEDHTKLVNSVEAAIQ